MVLLTPDDDTYAAQVIPDAGPNGAKLSYRYALAGTAANQVLVWNNAHKNFDVLTATAKWDTLYYDGTSWVVGPPRWPS